MEINNNLCTLCPRKCGVDRTKTKGMCREGEKLRISAYCLHYWEEPCISHKNGSGTVFFSGCPLKCVFCQNHEISHEGRGYEIDADRLSEIFSELKNMGAENINLVNPTHFSDKIKHALSKAKPFLEIPVVYNSGGYENVSALRELEGLIDIYLPDIKYHDEKLAYKYSGVKNYYETAIEAINEMYRQHTKQCRGAEKEAGSHADNVYDGDFKLLKGVIIRHLCLPSMSKDSFAVLDGIKENFGSENTVISLMRQYFPAYKAMDYPEINRKITTLEYERVVSYALSLGFKDGFCQEKQSAKSEYVPLFFDSEEENKKHVACNNSWWNTNS